MKKRKAYPPQQPMLKERYLDFQTNREIKNGTYVPLSDLLSVHIRKNEDDIARPGKPILFKNQTFGELHIGGIEDEFGKEAIHLPPIYRAHYFMAEAIEGLQNLSTLCRRGDERFEKVWLFLGISDVIRPNLVHSLGFSESNLSKYPNQQSAQKDLNKFRNKYYTLNSSSNKPVYEFWLPREELEEKHDLLGEKLQQIEERSLFL